MTTFAQATTPSSCPDEQPFIAPRELLAPILEDALPPKIKILEQWVENDIQNTELLILSEIYQGQEIYMHGWLSHPVGEDSLVPVLTIPGGVGISEKEFSPWVARTYRVLTLAVDWIGAGKSSELPGINPYPDGNAIYFEGTHHRDSYQYHNLRALLRATDFLVDHDRADPERLMADGGSWGGFYCWLLAGLDPRFKHIFPSFGCGFLDLECRNYWDAAFRAMGPEKTETWLQAFDPGRRAHLITAEVLYQHATNDKFFSLVSAMKTFSRVRSKKELLLFHNQDHTTHPYFAQDFKMMDRIVNGNPQQGMPAIRSARWIPNTNLVEVEAENADSLNLSIIYSGGNYTQSFARRWQSVPVRRKPGGYVAEIPVADVNREIWFYAHADRGPESLGASTTIQKIIPARENLTTTTTPLDLSFDFSSAPFWDLPIGDRLNPTLQIVKEKRISALSMKFTNILGRPLHGVAYCLEGDLIAKENCDAIELMIKVPDSRDLPGLQLILVTDYHALEEQTYGIELASLKLNFRKFQTVRIPFSNFQSFRHTNLLRWEEPLRPLEISRLCAIGFYHPDKSYEGEASMARIKPVRVSPKTPEPSVPRRADPSEPPSIKTFTPHPDSYEFHIPTRIPAPELREKLKQWEPWRIETIFSNGVRTSEFKKMAHFTPEPLAKWHYFKNVIPEEAIRGGRALDIGCNIGYHAFNLRTRYDMDVLGIDYLAQHIAVAEFLRDISGLDRVRFAQHDAVNFQTDERFNLILNLGTLDHLKNPMLALEHAAAMLKPDGYLALELQSYKGSSDETLCKFIPTDFQGDTSCWWFPGKDALIGMLQASGFDRIQILHEWAAPKIIGKNMRRLTALARKPASSA